MSSRGAPRLFIISIDGLWPELYLRAHAPYLNELTKRGSFARAMRPVYPTLTYTNHASLVTGLPSKDHGIYCNTRFDPLDVTSWRGGESRDWNLKASRFRAPTLWDLAREAKLDTALVRWPSTVGAQATWLLSETFSLDPTGPSSWEATVQSSTPRLIDELTHHPDFKPPGDDHRELDRITRDACLFLLNREQRPDLMLAHFTSLDHEAHEHGRASPRIPQILAEIDRSIRLFFDRLDLNHSTVFVLGDHGFIEFNKRVNINSLLAEAGLIEVSENGDKILDWKAIAHTNCAVAPVFLRSPQVSSERVIELLKAHSNTAYDLLSRDELDRLACFPNAICAVETRPGYSLGQKIRGPLVETIGCTRGEHGYRAIYPEIMTGFIACGPRVAPNHDLGEIDLLDVAPTAARILELQHCFPGKKLF